MAVPSYQEFMLPVLMLASRGETTISACSDELRSQYSLSEEDVSEMLPSGRQTRFSNRVHWAKSYLVQAGLLEMTGRGRFQATERGRQVAQARPARIDLDFLRQFPEFRDFQSREGTRNLASNTATETAISLHETPEEIMDSAHKRITDDLRGSLLERIVASSPKFFEDLILDLLVAMGYGGSRQDAKQRVGGTGDGGIDGIIKEDHLGLDVIYLQAKRYAPDNLVSADHLRGFSGSLLQRGAAKGVFVTTSRFSEPAREFVRGITQQRIILIDGEMLTDLLVKHGVGVRTDRTLEIKKLDLDYFEDPAE